jgi:hypothetical protein
MVDPEIGNAIPDKHISPTESVTKVYKSRNSDPDTYITQYDKLGLLGLIYGASGVKVVYTSPQAVFLPLAATLTLAFMVVVTSDISEDIAGPTDELLYDQPKQGVSGGLLSQFRELIGYAANAGGMLFASARNKDHVTLHISSGLMVFAMRDLPTEVWDKKS